MFRTMRPRRDELVLPEIHQTARGYEYHIYYPRGKAIHTVVLVYGMTIAGENDGRLLKFARSCANAGLKVIVPHLPGLMEYRFARGDLIRLIEIVSLLMQNTREKLGLIGFSTGGSYSLLLAGHPGLRDRIGPVVLFSPIYDARDVAKRLHTAPDPIPQTPKAWDQFYWTQSVIAFRNRENLKLSEAVQAALQILLTDWEDYALDVKRIFYENHIDPHQIFERTDLQDEGVTLVQLSARGQLAKVKSPVFILHDAADQIVPPDHSRRMHAELALRGAEFHQEILVTPWLSHVVLQNTGSLSELTKIVSFTAELFR
jgi:pimeloyl-ACP methyl ester carboxylesterase